MFHVAAELSSKFAKNADHKYMPDYQNCLNNNVVNILRLSVLLPLVADAQHLFQT